MKSHRVIKLVVAHPKLVSFELLKVFLTQAGLLEKPASAVLPDEGSSRALRELLRACVTSTLFGYRGKKQ